MELDEAEVHLWRAWKRTDTGETYIFIPAPYPDKTLNGVQSGHQTGMQLGHQITRSGRKYQFSYRIYGETDKIMLSIDNETFQVKKIDGIAKPATMILIDSLKEIEFVA